MKAPLLDLAIIGNSRIGALIDAAASVVWMCVPRFDGDPMFCALLDNNSAGGRFDVTSRMAGPSSRRTSPTRRSCAR